MKFPRWNGVTRPTSYIISLVFFFVGFAVITVFSLGRITYDDREGPGWNPVSRMPDGKIGLSDTAIESVGLAIIAIGVVAATGLGGLWKQSRIN